jgi:hypothetical protein
MRKYTFINAKIEKPLLIERILGSIRPKSYDYTKETHILTMARLFNATSVNMSFCRILTLVLGPLVVAFAAQALTLEQIPRIGLLRPFSLSKQGQIRIETFHKGVQDLGYREGENIFIEYRLAEGHPEQQQEMQNQKKRRMRYESSTN